MAASGPAPLRNETRPEVRGARPEDLAAIRRIYAHHVETGLASFEERAPEPAEMTRRFQAIQQAGDAYLVASLDGRIAGYAYAAPYRPRPAYRFVREGSVYVAPEAQRRGVGSALLDALVEACTEQGVRRLIAVIGDSDNQASIGLHRAHGFRQAGLLPSVGFKFGRWVDSVIMERPLGEGDSSLPREA